MGGLSLLAALDYLELLTAQWPDRLEPAAIRWHGRLEIETAALTMSESQLALAVLAGLRHSPEAAGLLRKLLRRVRPLGDAHRL